MSMGKIVVSPVPNEWLNCGEYDDIDAPCSILDDSHETLSETAVVGLIDQVERDVENGLSQGEIKESDQKFDPICEDHPIHHLKEAQKAAKLLYGPNAVIDSFEEPSDSSMDSSASASAGSSSEGASDFGMEWIPNSSVAPIKVVVFRGRESLMKLPETPTASNSFSSPNNLDATAKHTVDSDLLAPGAIKVVGIADDDISSYVTSTTTSRTNSSPPSPPRLPPLIRATIEPSRGDNRPPANSSPSPPKSVLRVHATVEPSGNNDHATTTPPTASGCFGCCKAPEALTVDCALLVSIFVSFSVILFVAILFLIYVF